MSKGMKICLIVFASILLLGLVLTAVGAAVFHFDFSSLNGDVDYTEMKKTMDLTGGETVKIETAVEEIRVGVSPDGQAHLVYYDNQYRTHEVVQSENEISISVDQKSQSWFLSWRLGWGSFQPYVELLLPASWESGLTVTTQTGAINLENLQHCKAVAIEVTTGRVEVFDIVAESVVISGTTARLAMSDLRAERIELRNSTGSISCERITADSLRAVTSTGSIGLKDANAEKTDLETTTGSINLTALNGTELSFVTTTGTISGTLSHAQDFYNIESGTHTGSNSLPTTQTGGTGSLRANTTTGSIRISFGEE